MAPPKSRVTAFLLAACCTALLSTARGTAEEARPAAPAIGDRSGERTAPQASVAGELIFVPGTLGTKPGTAEVIDGGTEPQAVQALRNIEQVLSPLGASLHDVVKCTAYLTDVQTVPQVTAAFRQLFPDGAPPCTTVGAAGLARGAAVEIECIAQRPKMAEADGAIERSRGFVQSGPEQIYYESTGRGDAVVFCHGAGGNHLVWYQQVPVFARSYRVITWDERGFGRSTNQAGLAGPGAAAADLQAILDHLGIRRAHLVGQSMGGWAALGFALAHPERVQSLTLSDTIGGIYTPAIRKAVQAYLHAAAAAPPAEALPLGQHPAFAAELARHDPARAFLYQEIANLRDPPPFVGALQKKTSYSRRALKGLSVPVLFIVGAADQIFPPAMIREAAKRIPRAHVIEIPGAGHSPYFEKPETWNALVLQFLRAAG